MNKNKGFTTVELIVSFTLVSIISFFLFQLIFALKNIFIDSGIRTQLLNKQAVISEKINYDFRTKKLVIAKKCGDECGEFIFDDGTTKQLSYNREEGIVTYGSHKEKIIDGSQFGNIKINSEILSMATNTDQLNGILTINIPIFNKFFDKEDFGINIIYQFNSFTTSVSGLNILDTIGSDFKIFLIGSENDIKFEGVEYNDPGFYLYNTENGEININSSEVTRTGTIGDELGRTYQLTYTFEQWETGTKVQVIRNVTVVKSSYNFDYTGSTQSLVIPISGTYKIETWGASGGGTSSMKGLGGYTVGTADLDEGSVLRIFVGGEGSTGTYDKAAKGGYNGGGDSGVSDQNLASSGGGASDVRLSNNNINSRIIVAGGGGGGGSRCDSSFKCNGGSGGGLIAAQGSCSSDTYVGSPGTQSHGGAAATYTTNCTTLATSGSLGSGGIGSTYQYSSTKYAAGGGGGGYYGGGGGSRYGGGAGGSGYCGSLTNCTTYTGTETFQSTNGYSFETGHNGNGYIKVTLLTVKN